MDKIFWMYMIIAIILLLLFVANIFPGVVKSWLDRGERESDFCKPGPGYTEESWKQHMSHHPDIYKECLK